MRGLERYVGQVLDGKYRLERLLGQGGMGAVYLATHLGTERYVALKLIAPEFMRNDEFVERFKREARAAGRLRHPNVVDVTDFGFAQTGAERVAYLIMEYLDGCTLGDVLAEEKQLPLEWVVDILEQVGSAVHEAHQQGIVHRDLKPDNIWLEPNRLGGYRVKVLDFGIAKLAEPNEAIGGAVPAEKLSHTSSPDAVTAMMPAAGEQTPANAESTFTMNWAGEKDTLLFGDPAVAPISEDASDLTPTLIPAPSIAPTTDHLEFDGEQTLRFPSPAGAAAVPVKVSAPVSANEDRSDPGARLPASGENMWRRSSHSTPQPASHSWAHEEDGTQLFNQHTQPLAEKSTFHPTTTASTEGLTRVGVIMGTPLYMSPEQCRGEHLDARADIYSLGVIAYQMLAGAPPFKGDMTTVMRHHIESTPPPLREFARRLPKRVARVVMSALSKDPAARPQTAQAFANSLRANADSLGSLYRRAFALYSEYFPKFLKLSFIAHAPVIVLTLLMIGWKFVYQARHPHGVTKVVMICILALLGLGEVVGYFLAASAISGMTAVIVTQLAAAPLRPVELRTAFAVLKKRWRPFLNTSIRMTLRILFFSILGGIPGIVVTVRYALYAPVVLMEGLEKKAARIRARQLGARSWRTVITVLLLQFLIPAVISSIFSYYVGKDQPKTNGVTFKVSDQLSGLFNIFVTPLMSIVPALLYLKMRQMGGESLNEAIAQIEEIDAARSHWQQRMRTRLTAHTPARTASGANR